MQNHQNIYHSVEIFEVFLPLLLELFDEFILSHSYDLSIINKHTQELL